LEETNILERPFGSAPSGLMHTTDVILLRQRCQVIDTCKNIRNPDNQPGREAVDTDIPAPGLFSMHSTLSGF